MIDPSLITQFGIPALVTMGALGLAYKRSVAREMFHEYNGECQAQDCIGLYMNERKNSYYFGYHVNMVHKTGMHKPGILDTDKSNGTCHCTGCHIVQHIRDGEIDYAHLIWAGQTIRSYGFIRSLMPNHDPNAKIDLTWDEKPPFEFYVEYAALGEGPENADEKWALAQGMKDELARQREAKQSRNQENFFFLMETPFEISITKDEDSYAGD